MTNPTTQKKLYEVQVTVPVYVYAESHDKANEAGKSLSAIATGLNGATCTAREVESNADVSHEVLHDRPYGSEKRTIGEILYMQSKHKPTTSAPGTK